MNYYLLSILILIIVNVFSFIERKEIKESKEYLLKVKTDSLTKIIDYQRTQIKAQSVTIDYVRDVLDSTIHNDITHEEIYQRIYSLRYNTSVYDTTKPMVISGTIKFLDNEQ